MAASLSGVPGFVLPICPGWLLGDAGRLAGVHFVLPEQFVVVNQAIMKMNPQEASRFQKLCPAPDAANGRVAVLSKARLRDEEAGTFPAVGDKDGIELANSRLDRLKGFVFPSEYPVGQLGVGFNLSSGSVGRHGESFLPTAR